MAANCDPSDEKGDDGARMRVSGFSAVFFAVLAVVAAKDATAASPTPFALPFANATHSGDDFNSGDMTLSGSRNASSSIALAQPNRFSMHQSYSLTAMATPQGSASSGLYLNTLSYQLTQPLSMFVDVGFYTPIHSSIPGVAGAGAVGAGSVVLPRMGLEYKPSDRLTLNLEMVNGADAWKASGGPWSPSPSMRAAGSRTP